MLLRARHPNACTARPVHRGPSMQNREPLDPGLNLPELQFPLLDMKMVRPTSHYSEDE